MSSEDDHVGDDDEVRVVYRRRKTQIISDESMFFHYTISLLALANVVCFAMYQFAVTKLFLGR